MDMILFLKRKRQMLSGYFKNIYKQYCVCYGISDVIGPEVFEMGPTNIKKSIIIKIEYKST